jgi:hypothetical protein
MHPFSLEQEQTEQVVGGTNIPKVTYYGGCTEAGGGIIPPGDAVTMAIPEDGYDPRFPPVR